MKTTIPNQTAERPFIISRTFNAPRELVWKAWTERERLTRWFGPRGSTMPEARMDLRPNGTCHFCLRSPDGKEYWGKWAFREITPPEQLIWVHSFADASGNLTRHPFNPTWPLELLCTVTLAGEGGKTKVTVQWLPLNPSEIERKTFDESHGSMMQGWGGTFEQLADYLAKA